MSSRVRRRLRVVISAPGFMLGGQARAAADIVAGFQGDDDLDVALQPIDPRLSGRWRFLTEWPVVRSAVRPLLYIRALRRHARNADVFHVFCAAHTAFLFGAVPAVWIAKRFGVPVVLNYHDGRAQAHFRFWRPVVLWAIRNAAEVVFPSAYLRRIFARQGCTGSVVPNTVDTSAFVFREPGRVRPRLISCRLLEPLYCVDNTIRAYARVLERYPDAVLDVYGSGISAPRLQELARALRLPGVRFHGAVPHERMPAVFAEGGILVNSSRIDNAPHVLIEAMAAGLPIASTNAGGIPDMVEHERTALLVPVGDPAALAAAVIRFLENPALAARIADAGRAECRRYSWSEAATGWRAVYGRVARRDVGASHGVQFLQPVTES